MLIETMGEKFGTHSSLLTTCLHIELMYLQKLFLLKSTKLHF